jgi:6-phosphogluconolactonase
MSQTMPTELFPDHLALAGAGAAGALELIETARVIGSRACVALSGGRIAKDFFTTVARLAKKRERSLAHVHFFWADERGVPPDHADSNYRSAAELLFTPLALPLGNLHRIRGEAEPECAAREAEAELRRFAPLNAAGQPVLDLVLLGMGEDGHIASLFPGESEEVMQTSAVYRTVTASKPPPRRITLGYAAIASAREVWVLASGAGKEEALRDSLSPDGQTPLARVLRGRGRTRVFTDLSS